MNRWSKEVKKRCLIPMESARARRLRSRDEYNHDELKLRENLKNKVERNLIALTSFVGVRVMIEESGAGAWSREKTRFVRYDGFYAFNRWIDKQYESADGSIWFKVLPVLDFNPTIDEGEIQGLPSL